MISVNDGEDLHFRKAEFDPDDCPPDCPRPCENVCPADAIFSNLGKAGPSKGVLAERCYGRCYGCGRCLPICPYDNIRAITYVRDVAATAKLIQRDEVDAIEIHTSGRQPESFQELWSGLGDSIHKLKLVAVSLPDLGDLTIPNGFYVGNNEDEPPLPQFMAGSIVVKPIPLHPPHTNGLILIQCFTFVLVLTVVGWPPYERRYWQRCNEGSNQICFTFSISRRQAIRFGELSILFLGEKAPLNSPETSHALISGVAFGGYARNIVGRVLSSLQSDYGYARLEDHPDHLLKAIKESLALVGTVKCYNAN
ncbi:hypothetical protein SASPL_109457 [Salvia splendens]|uniref:4Fe-4S ferredoxin-type domain-containing protein n=1 Tax=Salvia splendens TaxID=180675 RepID=A0A8X8YEW5_SALSN|nr:hypothetical protein SASPL_109457 [Salvia splendens]